jgi:site-specific DNA recombinase
MSTQRRAIGIIRVSRVAGRSGQSFVSPTEQRERIEAECAREGLELIDVREELDVSGGTPLDRRDGLRAAVEAVEAGKAEVIIAAYFDRLVRSLKVQSELVERIEKAGAQVRAVDVGHVTNGSAGQWLSGTLLGAVSEYQRRTTAERTADAQRRAIERGVAPYPAPAGYGRGQDGKFVPNEQAPIVRRAFEMRAEGKTVREVRAYLKANGIGRTYTGTYTFLKTRVVLGELHFGALANMQAHEPIVDIQTWERVQRTYVPKGRRPKSELLLARLGVLRCASCGSPMCGGSNNGGKNTFYRCTLPSGDCPARVTISTAVAERIVIEHVQRALADLEGRASFETNVHEAEQILATAQDALDAALRAFDGFDEPAARQRLIELREARDDAQERLGQLGGTSAAMTVTASADWHLLTLDEQRALIRATVERASVHPGRGAGRLTVELFGEEPASRPNGDAVSFTAR